MSCPYRPELSQADMPASIRRLPVDARGYPIPFFVDYVDGQPEFRAADMRKLQACVKESRCWVCGEPLHRSRVGFKSTLAFAIGPMCGINRISSEPPSHVDCAEWSARNCPFLARPYMRRREDEHFNAEKFADRQRGVALLRNPGVVLVWYTDVYAVVPTANGPLFSVGPLTRPPTWWAEGRPATREEIHHSIETGLPALRAACELEPTPERRAAAVAALERQIEFAMMRLMPREVSDAPAQQSR
jgi:hypothetical protein